MIVWVVRKEGRRCVYQFFIEALADWRSHRGEWRMLYPKFMEWQKFSGMKDFSGW